MTPRYEPVIIAARGVVAARTTNELRQAITQLGSKLAALDATKPASAKPQDEQWWTPPPAKRSPIDNVTRDSQR